MKPLLLCRIHLGPGFPRKQALHAARGQPQSREAPQIPIGADGT